MCLGSMKVQCCFPEEAHASVGSGIWGPGYCPRCWFMNLLLEKEIFFMSFPDADLSTSCSSKDVG